MLLLLWRALESNQKLSLEPSSNRSPSHPGITLQGETMKFFHYGKDGGPESTVHGFWFVEIKSLFSVALLRFSNGSREAYHSHAFNSKSWVLTGSLREEMLAGEHKTYKPSLRPVSTFRETCHRVISEGVSWVFTVRGPWSKTWYEIDPSKNTFTNLTHGRKVVAED